MQYIDDHTIDKTKWPDGPWKDEPDVIQWQDAETGYPCRIWRMDFSGHLCGYVAVGEDHPAYEKDYDQVKRSDGEYIDVHGGLTFAGRPRANLFSVEWVKLVLEILKGDSPWWLGFDCGHVSDSSPLLPNRIEPSASYRDIDFVKAECAKLAKQLAELA